ncbi:hypothetical protein BSZ22_02150 [Bradyrhizobium canariense]|nr:hypothetical protein BSZ22_02150 [Bradyrhizobium canariense]OSI82319.1 hypothetical protein BSZ23_02155 [Bradyrhizobium canariense]
MKIYSPRSARDPHQRLPVQQIRPICMFPTELKSLGRVQRVRISIATVERAGAVLQTIASQNTPVGFTPEC